MAILFTDLDGTLIFSAKRRTPTDIIVEQKDGEPISCISAYQQEVLPALQNVIPVTTRSKEQYLRIRFPKGFSPKYAITDNGGNLLVDGAPDPAWAEWAKSVTEKAAEELSLAKAALQIDPDRCFEIRMVDGLFLFTKSSHPEATLSRLGTGTLTESFFTGQKVYVIPKKLNKGDAAKRLLLRLRAEGETGEVVCAGDSRMDIPLLCIADAALFPEDIPEEMITARNKLTHPRERFTDFVTRQFYDRLR